jgi:hypothetical protein
MACGRRDISTQNEVMTLEKTSFFLIEKLKCHARNLFGDDAYVPVNRLANAYSSPKIKTRRIFVILQLS